MVILICDLFTYGLSSTEDMHANIRHGGAHIATGTLIPFGSLFIKGSDFLNCSS